MFRARSAGEIWITCIRIARDEIELRAFPSDVRPQAANGTSRPRGLYEPEPARAAASCERELMRSLR
jgi:hypothetical protein